MKPKLITISIATMMSIAAAPALAQVQVITISPPASLADPLGGFSVNYTLGGSSVSTSGQLTFFLSASRDGSTGLTPLFSRQLQLQPNGSGLFVPPSGTQSQPITRSTMDPAARTLLQNLNPGGCQAQSLFIVAQVDFGTIQGSNPTTMGTAGRPDFEFTGGTISPTVIRPGGTTFISFELFTQCAAPRSSTVGVLLTDVNLNVLAVIGTIGVGAGAGTFRLPSTGISFGTGVPPGNYRIVLAADFNEVIAESNENNNLGAFSLVVARGLGGDADAVAGAPEEDELEPGVQLPYDLDTALGELDTSAPPFATM
jgi:hypothetical protein